LIKKSNKGEKQIKIKANDFKKIVLHIVSRSKMHDIMVILHALYPTVNQCILEKDEFTVRITLSEHYKGM
jgi:hypothetical protein